MSRTPREAVLKELTEEQRRIVHQLGQGPVKVVASAGSGKTTTMAALYSVAVADGTLPPRILAVTFTNRAATELRERITTTLQKAGVEAPEPPAQPLQGAWIGTFHHVARRLLEEMPYQALVPRDLRTLDDVEARQELEAAAASVREAMAADRSVRELQGFDLPPRTLLELSEGAIEAVTRLRSTDLTPEECRRRSEAAYSAFAANGDAEAEIRWHRLSLRVTLAVWERLEERLRARRSLDFDGLLRLALDCLRSSPSLAGWCRENFQLVIVDEFQDTSQVQAALLQELVGPDLRKLFVVGDARQSIFAFRDAQPGIMARTVGRSFRLVLNHRSFEPILVAADEVIRADSQFAGDDRMEVVRRDLPAPPVLLGLAATPEEEAEGIAAFIEAVHLQGLPGDGEPRPVGYGDIAVLARTFGRLGEPLEDSLRRRGIPFRTATGGLLERPEVKDLLALLRVVADEDDDQAWVRVLQSAWVRLSDQQMAVVAGAREARDQPLAHRVRAAIAAERLDPAVLPRVAEVAGLVLELRQLAAHRPAAEVVQEALLRSRLLPYHRARQLAGAEHGERSVAAIRDLQRLALDASSSGRWLSLGEFLAKVTTMAGLNGQAEPPPLDDRPLVTISTIHRAKGLEWPVVILADCRPHHTRGRPAVVWDREQGAVLMPRLARRDTAAGARWKSSPDSQVPLEEHRRLVYVAMTRARDLLLVTTTRPGMKTSARDMEELLSAARAGDPGNGEYAELVRAAASGAQSWVGVLPGFPDAVRLPWGDQPVRRFAAASEPAAGPLADGVLLAHLAAEAAGRGAPSPNSPAGHLSFSALQLLEACPRQFWFRHVARMPAPVPAEPDGSDGAAATARSGAMEVGSVVHQVLERSHRRSPQRQPSDQELEGWLRRLGPGMSSADQEEAGQMLRNYAALPLAALPTVGVEVAFLWRGWAGPNLPHLGGVIDRIAAGQDGSPVVIDYKTNRELTKTQFETYSHQLRLYAMALTAMRPAGASAPRAVLVMLRSGEVMEVDCGEPARGLTMRWAGELARLSVAGGDLSGLGHSARPCASCAYAPICPERLGGAPSTAVDAVRSPAGTAAAASSPAPCPP